MKITKKMACILGASAVAVVAIVVAIVMVVSQNKDTDKNTPDTLVVASSDEVLFPEKVVETETPEVEFIIDGTAVPDMTEAPTEEPTEAPTEAPTPEATREVEITEAPAEETEVPTKEPVKETAEPTKAPEITAAPTKAPIVTEAPTEAPKVTTAPTPTPAKDIWTPTVVPTVPPTAAPTTAPAPTEVPVVACSHEWIESWFSYPTCTVDGGYTPKCTKCGEFGEWVDVPETGHDYEATLSFEGNCRAQAVYKNVCKTCGWEGSNTYGDSLHPDDHEWIETSGEVWNEENCRWETVIGFYCGRCNKTKEQ